jgi:hypothetical protein
MNGRRTAVGLSLLCALLFSAFAASSAFAAEETTAVTCVKNIEPGGAGFSDEHCDKAVQTGAAYKHVQIGETSTLVEGDNQKTANNTTEHTTAVLHGLAFGTETTITATKVTVEGTLKNEPGPPKSVLGKDIVLTYEELTVSKGPKGCKVKGAEIKTNKLRATTTAKSMEVEFKPPEGSEIFATFQFEGCENKSFNGVNLNVTGTSNGIPHGATLETTEASTKGLKFAGQQASYTSTVTLRMKKETQQENPIALTTF